MDQYKKKIGGVIIEAVKLTEDNIDKVANWCGAQVVEEHDALQHDTIFEALNVRTPNGRVRASQGYYVIRVGRDFFVQNGTSFENMYDKVTYNI